MPCGRASHGTPLSGLKFLAPSWHFKVKARIQANSRVQEENRRGVDPVYIMFWLQRCSQAFGEIWYCGRDWNGGELRSIRATVTVARSRPGAIYLCGALSDLRL